MGSGVKGPIGNRKPSSQTVGSPLNKIKLRTMGCDLVLGARKALESPASKVKLSNMCAEEPGGQGNLPG